MIPLLRALHRLLGQLIDRLEPQRETEPPQPPAHWDQAELAACPDMRAVDLVLARWIHEGVPELMAAIARSEEFRRRLAEGVRVNSWGGSA